jgi:hypothetical protein
MNLDIYHLHISLANTWNKSWPYIQHTVEDKLQNDEQTKYKTLDKNWKN